jgi:2-C-methyl-D-erythritol 4-phosphate cytidylyltransferase/2-C-methyl-D-erythritol 2,4-cyclodiphosphate synthase
VTRGFADALIVAAGSSRRMGGLDKLLVDLGGRPSLAWSIAAMRATPAVARVILVVAPDREAELGAVPGIGDAVDTVVTGGPRRQDSVAHGVAAGDAEVVLVHDGARPFASPALVERVATAARRDGAAIPVVPVVDSLKRLDADGRPHAVSRDGLLRAQTPQGVRRELLSRALAVADSPADGFGDEAELLAAAGIAVTTVEGEERNLKLTQPGDVPLAQALAGIAPRAVRYASATDVHPFGPDDGLRLGGITIPEAPRLAGHSDGDAGLHAVADAILAAAAMPDLGRRFPAGDPATRGIDSSELLRAIVTDLAAAGWAVDSVDLSITGARPRLGGRRLDAMRAAIADAIGVPLAAVSVKASTGNLGGDEGAGRSISASALVGVAPR